MVHLRGGGDGFANKEGGAGTHPSVEGRSFVKPVCLAGHDKRVVGINSRGRCLLCSRLYEKGHKRAERRSNPEFRGDAEPIPNLKAVRIMLGVSQQRAASMIGVHPNYLCRMEAGVRFPSSNMRDRIIAAYAPLLAARRERIRRLDPW